MLLGKCVFADDGAEKGADFFLKNKSVHFLPLLSLEAKLPLFI
jgi:hypothetical protein